MDIVARFLLHGIYRSAAGLPPRKAVILLLGGFSPKLRVMASIFRIYGEQVMCLLPMVALRGADFIAQVVEEKGFSLMCVIPLADCAVGVADILNSRVGVNANDPATSDLRRDKLAQQEALRAAGLPIARQRAVADAETAARFAAELLGAACAPAPPGSPAQPAEPDPGEPGVPPSSSDDIEGVAVRRPAVVVKPRDSSGGDGIWVCHRPDQVRDVVGERLGRLNIEGFLDSELIVMEALIGEEEWVVNSVSLHGIHKFLDMWYGPPKVCRSGGDGGPAQFLYTEQYLALESQRRADVLEFCCKALDALGLRNGAAHTELLWTVDGPRLLEVNARASGGLPRAPGWPNQLEAMAMALFDKVKFAGLRRAPDDSGVAQVGGGAAVVFLRSDIDGWMTRRALQAIVDLRTFRRFERRLLGLEANNLRAVSVQRTVDLGTSPGSVVLHGRHADVHADVAEIRRIEASGGYVAELSPEPPAKPPESEAPGPPRISV